MGIDKERNKCFSTREPGFGTQLLPGYCGAICHGEPIPLYWLVHTLQGDEAGGGYLGLEVSVVWLPQKGTSA